VGKIWKEIKKGKIKTALLGKNQSGLSYLTFYLLTAVLDATALGSQIVKRSEDREDHDRNN